MFAKGVFGKMMLGLLLSIAMLAVSAGLSLLITGKLNELVVILTITTLAIAASFSEKVRNLPKTFELGMFFILIFSVVVASQFNIYSVDTSAMAVMGFIAFVLLVALCIHLILSRIFKVHGDLFTVAQVGLLCSPPFIPPVVGAMGNRKVLISGIVIGLVIFSRNDTERLTKNILLSFATSDKILLEMRLSPIAILEVLNSSRKKYSASNAASKVMSRWFPMNT